MGRSEKEEKLPNLYATLEVSFDAEALEIKMAYLEIAKRYHPDVNPSPGAKEKFAQANMAYQVLSNESSRNDYDSGRLDKHGDKQAEWNPYEWAGFTPSWQELKTMEEEVSRKVFEEMYGKARPGRRSRSGRGRG
uniref:J domain-containing protein n=1 Tax=Hemiselmis andersenii TaxID=464988 RepID=A0A6T8KKR5_HEMAN|mmetsp:Transcript_38010/g.88747  ORF Transcript_38010/g.88747 Transcript_38010/m.88747 type:complete len:135 (+) Transcript_38010:167-571(+)